MCKEERREKIETLSADFTGLAPEEKAFIAGYVTGLAEKGRNAEEKESA